MPGNEIARVLWDWNVKAYDYGQKLEAAVAGGFDILTVPYRFFRPLIDSGTAARDILSMADDSGIKLDFLDGMTSWGSVRYPPGNELFKAGLDFSVDDALRLCEELELTQVVAVSGFDSDGVLPREQIVDEFGRFCDQAAKQGVWVDLEPMAFVGLNTLEFAWDVVRRADRPNSGIVFDTWHFTRADRDLDALRAIPRGKIRNAQVVDSRLEPISEDMWDDVFGRTLPGDGELDLVGMLTVLRETHDISYIGPEAIDERLDNLAPRDLGVRAAETTERVIAEAGFSPRQLPAGR